MANQQGAVLLTEGVVSATNNDGIKLTNNDGTVSDWLNWSQYHPQESTPIPGELVQVHYTLTGNGRAYITEWQPIGTGLPKRSRATSSPAPESVTPAKPAQLPTPPTPTSGHTGTITPRDILVARMSALKSAAALAQVTITPDSDARLTATYVLEIADTFDLWLKGDLP